MHSNIDTHKFAEYFNHYINLVKNDYSNVIDALEQTQKSTNELLGLTTEDKGNFAYAEGKWTIKELLVHIIDTERIFCNRAIRFARNDKTDLPGFDHDLFVENSFANDRSLNDIMSELNLVRAATIALFKSFNEKMLNQTGTANGNQLTVLAIGYVIAGHEKHHINILKERYL